MQLPFDRVVVDRDVFDLEFTRSFVERVPSQVSLRVGEPGEPPPRGRRTVHVTREAGSFLKPCPCSPGTVGCGYWVLTPAFQCPYSCTYCFLRFYAPDEPLTLYANLEDASSQFSKALALFSGFVRMGTGEFADSLALDPWTGHASWLQDLVAPHPRVNLELKTKSVHVEALLERRPLANVVVAWSVNPEERVKTDEGGTASLADRLRAATRVARAGYRVAFHFDPIVLATGWETVYRDLVGQVFEAVEPARVAWVSLGTLRFPARFVDRWGPTLRGRRIFFDEFVPGEDGKLRYFWPLRREAYRALAGELRRRGGSGVPIYLCMEPPGMWGAALGWTPEPGEVARHLTEECIDRRGGAGDGKNPGA